MSEEKLTINEAVTAAKGLAKHFKAVLMVAEILDQISGLQAYRADLVAKYQDLQVQVSDKEAELALANENIEKAKVNLEVFRDSGRAMVETAEKKAEKIVAKAEEQGRLQLENLQSEVSGLQEIILRTTNEHEARLKSWQEEEVATHNRLQGLKAELASLRERFDG